MLSPSTRPTWSAGATRRWRGTGCVHARRRFGRCKLISLPIAAAAALVVCGVAAPDPGRTVLVFPTRGHWLLEPMRDQLSEALPAALREAGFEVVTARPDSPLVQQARRERPLRVGVEVTPEQLEEGRYALAVLGDMDAVLTTEVTGDEAGVAVQAELAGAISRRPVRLEARAAATDPEAAAALAGQLAAAITPEVWQQAGADEEGRRAAAAERYAAGQAAMAAHQYREAAEQFEAALAGDETNPEYLRGAAEADLMTGEAQEALSHSQGVVRLLPDDPEARLLLGDVALRAGRPETAEAAFLVADRMLPDDPRAVEGLARTYRAEGDTARAREHYQRLVALVPVLRGEPPFLVGLLAGLRTDRLRFAGVSDEEATRALAFLYLQEGQVDRGIDLLLRYHQEAERPAYGDADYLVVARRLDEQATLLARLAEELLRLAKPSDIDDAGMEQGLDETHERSERLAEVAERIRVSEREDAAHRYRVLAYHLLNESNFEALLYSRTNDAGHERRASLLRDASRKARQEASTLDVAPQWPVAGEGAGRELRTTNEAPPEPAAGEERGLEAGGEKAPPEPAAGEERGLEAGGEEAPPEPAAGEERGLEAGADEAPPEPGAGEERGLEAGGDEAAPEPAAPAE